MCVWPYGQLCIGAVKQLPSGQQCSTEKMDELSSSLTGGRGDRKFQITRLIVLTGCKIQIGKRNTNWNANLLKSKRSTLAKIPSQNKIEIASITETQVKVFETFKITGYEINRNDRKHTHSSGGVVILIKKKT